MAWAQERTQPYALRLQNVLARWMYISNALLVVLGTAFTAVAQYDTKPGAVALEGDIESLLVALVLLDVILATGFAAAILLLEWRTSCCARGRSAPSGSSADLDLSGQSAPSGSSAELDLSGVLLAATEPIDGPLRECLADGSIRLLRGAWLADADASGAVLLRRQELPPEAFVTCAEAVEMLDRGDRSILALS